MARVMENHSKSLLPIPDVTSTTTRGFATQVLPGVCLVTFLFSFIFLSK